MGLARARGLEKSLSSTQVTHRCSHLLHSQEVEELGSSLRTELLWERRIRQAF